MCIVNRQRHLPMQKSYLLLRHNQQSGPFSLEELLRMSLQPKDLIWIIGQSAGWRYPEEIEAVKAYVQGAPLKVTTSSPEQEQALAPTGPQAAPVGGGQPGRHVYVSMPVKTTTAPSAGSEPDTNSLSFEERVEKMRQRVAAVDTQKAAPADPDVEIKYSRSLEDIKAEYTTWMHTQKQKHKHKRKIGLQQVGVVAGISVAALGLLWTANELFSHRSDSVSAANINTTTERDFYPTVILPPKPVSTKTISKKIGSNETREEQHTLQKTLPLAKEKPAPQGDTAQSIVAKSVDSIAAADDPVETTEDVLSQTTAEKPATVAEQLHINAAYVAGSKKSTGVEGLAVTVKNNSSQVMKVVAVDVIYFKEGMAELERKTLYFSNLQPGQMLTRNAPAHKKAEGAYAQLGLISSEEGSIFYASNK